jgi:[calcium/calmodulin-dependent protein kinase] kinase
MFLKRAKGGDVSRLRREAALLARVSHPSIIKYLGFREDLPAILLRLHPLGSITPAVEAVTLKRMLAVAGALRYLHEEVGIIHGDVKPENILLSSDGSAVLADFSHSVSISDWQAGMGYGTLMFTCPEICVGDCLLPKAADVWAFGMTLLVLLNHGKYPFTTVLDLFENLPSFKPPKLAVSSLAQNIIDSCLVQNPASRFLQF